MDRRDFLHAAATSALSLTAGGASAQDANPTRSVRMLVGFAAGSALDLMARLLAQRMTERLGQPFVVENRAGANGAIATEAAARAVPDGHTLMMANIGKLVINPAAARGAGPDPALDLAPVAKVLETVLVVAVPADLPARTFAEFVDLARARAGQFNMGSAGSGDLGHLAFEMLKRHAGLDITHVPYRGSGPALQDLLGGRVQLMISPYLVFRGAVEAGRVRVLAVTSAERLAALPTVPTVVEAGGPPGFEATGFAGLVAPGATPRLAIARLTAAVAGVMRETDLPSQYEVQGLVPRYADAETFAALIARDRDKWGRVIREADITLD